jgi:hypothetical protein
LICDAHGLDFGKGVACGLEVFTSLVDALFDRGDEFERVMFVPAE